MPTLRTLPRLFCMPIFFLASWASFGQGRIDSLKALLNTEITFHEQVDVLLELSKECYSLNDSISIAFAKQALQTASRIKYFKGQKYAYTLLGQGLASSGKLHEAKSNFQRSHAVKSKQVSSLISYNLLEWGNTMTQLGAYDSSMLLYEQARKEPDLEMATLQILYANIAHVNVLLSQNARAFAYLDSAESLEYDDDAQMKVLSVYGLIYQNLTDYDKANECYQRLNILANKRNDNYYKIECQLNFSRLAIMHGEFRDALTYSLEALALTNKYNRTQYVDVLIQTAEAYMELSQLEFTGQFLYQALKLSEESEMEHRVALIYNDLAG